MCPMLWPMTPHQPNDDFTGFGRFDDDGKVGWALFLDGEVVTASAPFTTEDEALRSIHRLVRWVVEVGGDCPIRGFEDTEPTDEL